MNSRTFDLTPDRWARVEFLFDRAVELPLDRREQFLRDSCSDDELCTYVVSLLQIDSAGANDLEKTVVDALQSAISDAMERKEEMQGALLGPYRIVRTLGSGGMGIVYLAERADEQYEQQVAIKLGRHRLVDHSAEQRLRDERQILANLDHPNIARLLDGGTADDGTPYIVMEYIDGVRIDTFCDRNRLSIEARLEQFQAICSAVHYAHQNLVVHRDIKPSNILVTDDGIPKLLDFGIAKLIDAQGAATDGLTREGVVMLTPENAAPEQVLGKPITTATDTYALGLLLYSLLTGMPAYSLQDKHPSEIARVICQKNPLFPSVRVAGLVARARQKKDEDSIAKVGQIAGNRGLTADRLARRLRGDIDTIVLNALRKEPERRYRSVTEFAEDIRLHEESLPIVARADSWSYRTGKFVRRHYAGVTMSGVLVSLLILFGFSVSVQNSRIAEQRDRARVVSTFLEEIFMSPDPERAKGVDVTAKEILEAGAARIDRELIDQPETRAALMATIGRSYLNLGDYSPARDMLSRSLELRKQTLGDGDPIVSSNKNELAETLIKQANYDEAEELLLGALQEYRNRGDEASDAVAKNMLNLAELYLAKGEINRAETFAESSIETYSALGKHNTIRFAEAKSLLARILQTKGDLDRTETLLREAIQIVRDSEGPEHPEMAYYLQSLGVLLQSKGDLSGAEKTLQEALEATRRILGEEHDLIAGTLVFQGTVFHAKGDLVRAETALRDAVSLHAKMRGSNHPLVGYDLIVLGALLHDKRDLSESEEALRQAILIFNEVLGDEHQYVASALTELGAVLTTSGDAESAIPLLRRAMDIRQKDYSADSPLIAATNTELGTALVALEQFDEAEPVLLSSYQVFLHQDNRRSRRAEAAVVRLYEAWGKPEMAANYRR